MAKELFAHTLKKVVPFEQNGDFYYRKARKYIESNNYINALSYYRKALEKEPDNIDYSMDLAEVFTEMGYFNESNQILFSVIQKSPTRPECYFGMGCNFLGLQEYEKAQECLEKYLDLDYDGPYADEAADLLDILQNQDYYFDKIDEVDPVKAKVFLAASKGKTYLDRGDYRRAIKELEKVVRKEPSLVFARNNLALAYYCTGKVEKAIEISAAVVDEYPFNVHANCNLALFYYEQGDMDKSQACMSKVLSLPTEDPEELHKIVVTLCELKQHEKANQLLKKLLRYKPYDIKVLHYMAVSCYNLKLFKTAYKYWDKIGRINPGNTISAYYKHLVQSVISGKTLPAELPYNFQVPYDEIVRRIKKINDLLKLPSRDLQEKWRSGESLSDLLRWGLDLNDTVIKRAILNVVASFSDEKSESFLREFILRSDEDQELIREALAMLKQMGAQGPYIAMLNGSISKVNVSLEKDYGVNDSILEDIPQVAVTNLTHHYGFVDEQNIRHIWSCVIRYWHENGMPRIRKPEGWAAALELYYCERNGIAVNKDGLARSYGVSRATLLSNLRLIEEAAILFFE